MNLFKSLAGTLRFVVTHPLNRDRKLTALKNWAKWQLGSRLVPGAVAVPYVERVRMLVEPGLTGATGNVYAGLHEFEDMAFVLHSLRREDLFVDIGANVGSYTLLAGGAVGSNCVAVEPICGTFERLRSNVLLNDLCGRVELKQVAVGNEEGTIRFTSGLDTENHALEPGQEAVGGFQEVEITTLDKLLSGARPRVMKIDVEGFETNVIAGGDATFSAPELDAVLIELTGLGPRYGFDETAVHQRLLDYGFRTYSYDPFARSLKEAPGIKPVGNTLYLKNVDVVARRLREAPCYHVAGQRI